MWGYLSTLQGYVSDFHFFVVVFLFSLFSKIICNNSNIWDVFIFVFLFTAAK